MNRPTVVSAEEWRAARDELLVKEKKFTRALDALAAERRRLPMTRLDGDYAFTAPDGTTVGLTGLFDGYRQLVIVRDRFGYTVPWYSSYGTTFNDVLGLRGFGLSVLLHDRDTGEVFRTYFTDGRGVDRLRMDFNLLDLTPYGRQEEWEDSPDGWPQSPTMHWLRHKDEYTDEYTDRKDGA